MAKRLNFVCLIYCKMKTHIINAQNIEIQKCTERNSDINKKSAHTSLLK